MEQTRLKLAKVTVDLDLERRVLAGMFDPLDGQGIQRGGLLRELSSEDFTDGLHKRVFEAVQVNHVSGLPVDFLRIRSAIPGVSADEVNYLLEICTNPTPTYYIWRCVRELKSKTKQRAAKLAIRRAALAFDSEDDEHDPTEFFAKAIEAVRELEAEDEHKPQTLAEGLHAFQAETQAVLEGKPVVAYTTGFDCVDSYFKYTPQNLYYFAGRPGMGKTVWVVEQALILARQGLRGLFVSVEMSTQQLMQRLVTAKTGIPSEVFRDGLISEKEMPVIKAIVDEFSLLPLKIVDGGIETAEDIRRWMDEDEYDFVVVDYLQCLGSKDTRTVNREQIVGDNSWKLKILAKEYKVPVIAAAQLSRALETRAEKRPTLADLRESGRIEQDAAVVGFIHRDNYYDKEAGVLTDDEDGNKVEVAEIIVAKNRFGSLGTGHVGFRPERAVFTRLKRAQHNNW